MTRFFSLATVGIALALSGCAPLVTQSPGGAFSPVNAHAIDGNERVLLNGTDVVTYFTLNKDVRGNPSIKSTYENVTVIFLRRKNKALFDKEPTKYLPQYGGYCANGIVYGISVGRRCRCMAHDRRQALHLRRCGFAGRVPA